MFTGIVEEVGLVAAAAPGHLRIQAGLVLEGTRAGDSIAVDGTCLTAVAVDATSFSVGVQPETLRRTTLGDFRPGRRVNLERAMPADGRFGGHIVQGHVDGTGRIRAIEPDGDALRIVVEAPIDLMHYVVAKGFIAVSGVSLTVVDVGDDWFGVAIVQYTRDHVATFDGGVGAGVNLEVDIIGKYVERLLAGREEREHVIRNG